MDYASLTDFRKVAKTSLDESVKKYISEQRLEINKRLLGRFLIKNLACFKRCVTQDWLSRNHQYYLMPEIGRVSGKRLFFEVINPELDAVNLQAEKSGTRTSPPTVVDLEYSNKLCHRVVDYLISFDISDRSKASTLVVPPDFYVFEFKAKRQGREETITVEPFKAKNIGEALFILSLCPDFRDYGYMHSFKVCTDKGWRSLSSKLRNTWIKPLNATVGDYVLGVI